MTKICDECGQSAQKLSRLQPGNLCDSCAKQWNESHRLKPEVRKPARLNQNQPFQALPTVQQLINDARRTVDPEVIEYLKKLPLEILQKEITDAIAVFTMASAIYGNRFIEESLKKQAELKEQHQTLVRQWRDKQYACEREKRARSTHGMERKHYERTGKFLNETIDDMLKEFEARYSQKNKD